MFGNKDKKFIEAQNIDKASKDLDIKTLKEYFQNVRYPTNVKTIKGENEDFVVDPIKNIKDAIKSSDDIKKVFDDVFSESEKLFHDLRASRNVFFNNDDRAADLENKIIGVVKEETGFDLLKEPWAFFDNNELNSEYRQMFSYLQDLGANVPNTAIELLNEQENGINNTVKDEPKEPSLTSKIKNKLK